MCEKYETEWPYTCTCFIITIFPSLWITITLCMKQTEQPWKHGFSTVIVSIGLFSLNLQMEALFLSGKNWHCTSYNISITWMEECSSCFIRYLSEVWQLLIILLVWSCANHTANSVANISNKVLAETVGWHPHCLQVRLSDLNLKYSAWCTQAGSRMLRWMSISEIQPQKHQAFHRFCYLVGKRTDSY